MSSSYIFEDRAELDIAVSLWCLNDTIATTFYGEINTWDVSAIDDFYALFEGENSFNDDISNWDVSSGTDFRYMFFGADAFNQDIRSWDVSAGNEFGAMFFLASAFNQDISFWNVNSGADLNNMLLGPGLMNANGWSATPSDADFNGQTRTGDETPQLIQSFSTITNFFVFFTELTILLISKG